MFPRNEILFCCLLLVLNISIFINPTSSHELKRNSNSSNDKSNIDDILNDTFKLLDVLDEKLNTVNNKTPNALMRDNLRALDGASNLADVSPVELRNSRAQEEDVSIDEALVKLAEGFYSGRQSDELLALASGNNQLAAASSPVIAFNEEEDEVAREKEAAGASNRNKKSRQIQNLPLLDEQTNQLASDSTERHIKFTLDLMQSIFSSQLYSPKTNLIESFLISPLSIQTVLMMMHLGARGQTRREISNCLHLNVPDKIHHHLQQQQQLTANPESNLDFVSHQAKLKRRHQVQSENVKQQQQHSNGAKLSAQNPRSQQSQTTSSQHHQHQISTGNAHELFGNAVRNLLKDPIVTKALTSANQIFLQKNLPLSSQYEWAIRHYYAADVKLVDFQHQTSSLSSNAQLEKGKMLLADNHNSSPPSPTHSPTNNTANLATNSTSVDSNVNNIQQLINDWIERQTRGKISNFLSSPVSTSTLMMAINVLYFKGDWQYKFDPTDTETDAWFTQANGKAVKMPMMVNRLPLAFAHDPNIKTSVIELPYRAQRLGLFLLLPDEVSGIFNTMQMLNSTSFANLISSMRKPSISDQNNGINVRIPKFSIESTPRLSQILSQHLGLKSLFMPDSADLSGMFAPLQFSSTTNNKRFYNSTNNTSNVNENSQQIPLQVGLDELLHKAVLQVDEQGSVAAASSATIVERVGLFNSNYFEADHPFLLFLMDKQTGLVLFSGVFAGNNASGSSSSNGSINNSTNSSTTPSNS